MIPSNELIRFFQNLETMEESKKAIADDIKDGIDAFANNNGVNPKALKRAYRDYKVDTRSRRFVGFGHSGISGGGLDGHPPGWSTKSRRRNKLRDARWDRWRFSV